MVISFIFTACAGFRNGVQGPGACVPSPASLARAPPAAQRAIDYARTRAVVPMSFVRSSWASLRLRLSDETQTAIHFAADLFLLCGQRDVLENRPDALPPWRAGGTGRRPGNFMGKPYKSGRRDRVHADRLLVRGGMQPPPCAEQLDLRAGGDQPLDPLEHLDHVGGVGGDEPRGDSGTPVQVLPIGLRDGDIESAPDLGHERAHHRALGLQRVHVAEQQVELDPSKPHGSIMRHVTALCRADAAVGTPRSSRVLFGGLYSLVRDLLILLHEGRSGRCSAG